MSHDSLQILTVIQARLGSSRLPGKVLLPLGDSTVLEVMCERVSRSEHKGKLVVATTTDSEDDALVTLCQKAGIAVFRGHPTDLLDRHYQALLQFGGDAVVKIPSDCPLIDPAVVDRVIGYYKANAGAFDFVSNLHPQSYPDGNDVEVMSSRALETAWREARREFEREHTTSFLWDNPDRFRLANVAWETGEDLSKAFRWTLDYPEDYELIRRVFAALHPKHPHFGLSEILTYLRETPEVRDLNAKRLGYLWYAKHEEELRTCGRGQHG